jgi:hypothetical protein
MSGKKAPTGIPQSIKLQQNNFNLSFKDQKNFKNLGLSMKIDGGVHGEKFKFDFDANAKGEVVCGMNCQLSDRQHKVKKYKVNTEVFQELFNLVNIGEYLKLQNQIRIPPCSLIGRIELRNGKEKMEFIFMADKGQAEEVGYRIPDAMSVLIEKIYTITERQLKSKDIRP